MLLFSPRQLHCVPLALFASSSTLSLVPRRKVLSHSLSLSWIATHVSMPVSNKRQQCSRSHNRNSSGHRNWGRFLRFLRGQSREPGFDSSCPRADRPRASCVLAFACPERRALTCLARKQIQRQPKLLACLGWGEKDPSSRGDDWERTTDRSAKALFPEKCPPKPGIGLRLVQSPGLVLGKNHGV